MDRTTKMYGWLYEAFNDAEFTLADFKAIFPSPQHKKVIHDLVRFNFVRRVERGKYRVTKPNDLVKRIVAESLAGEDVLRHAQRKYAYCDNDAVTIWTEGYYLTGFTKGFKPVHVRILRKDLGYWQDFFSKHKVEYAVKGERKTLFGLTYILHPVADFKVEKKEDYSVIPLEEVVRFCKANELTYRPALEYLDERYKLRLFKKYEHIH